jgi:hypothetical protein
LLIQSKDPIVRVLLGRCSWGRAIYPAALVITIFEVIDKIHVVDEKLLNAVTSLAGFVPCGFSPVEVDRLMFL